MSGLAPASTWRLRCQKYGNSVVVLLAWAAVAIIQRARPAITSMTLTECREYYWWGLQVNLHPASWGVARLARLAPLGRCHLVLVRRVEPSAHPL